MAATRRPGRNHLFIPGPTTIPDRVIRAMSVQSEDHRSPSFPELAKPLFQDAKMVYGTTDGTILLYPSSGTGIWESALTNTLCRVTRWSRPASASSATSGSTWPNASAST